MLAQLIVHEISSISTLLIFLYFTIFYLSVLMSYRPYEDIVVQRIQMINEVTYCLIVAFLVMIPNSTQISKIKIGNFIIVITLTLLGFGIVYGTLVPACRKIKIQCKNCRKVRAWKKDKKKAFQVAAER